MAVYDGFELVPETETDGWIYGAITEYLEPNNKGELDDVGCHSGDGFVQAPDGSQAGLAWEVVKEPYFEICVEPDKQRWGVFALSFERTIRTTEDLVHNFRRVLPMLQKEYERIKAGKD